LNNIETRDVEWEDLNDYSDDKDDLKHYDTYNTNCYVSVKNISLRSFLMNLVHKEINKESEASTNVKENVSSTYHDSTTVVETKEKIDLTRDR
jgi:hypothetical protein